MNLDELVIRALEEDVGDGDVTTDSLGPPRPASAVIRAKEEGVLFGLEAAMRVLERSDPGVELTPSKTDGDLLVPGDVVLVIRGTDAGILRAERVALNFLQHLSGIATAARRCAAKLQHAKVYDTRKTLPLFRALQKAAVAAGGGRNHRMGLYDGVLIKDNHIAAAGSVAEALRRVAAAHPGMPREVEVKTEEQLAEALANGAEMILLDNMTPDRVRGCLEIVAASGKSPEMEVSGNVTEETIADYDFPGVHRISLGSLTHSVKALDLSLKFV